MTIAKWFKHQLDDGSAYIGLASGRDLEELFWAIDEYVDPHSVDVITAGRGGYCRLVRELPNGDEIVFEITDWEASDAEPMLDDYRWKPARWPGAWRSDDR